MLALRALVVALALVSIASAWSVTLSTNQRFIFPAYKGPLVALSGYSTNIDIVNVQTQTLVSSPAGPSTSEAPHSGSVCIDPDTNSYFFSGESYFYARDINTGANNWKSATWAKAFGPTCYGGVVYISTPGVSLTAVNASSGVVLWSKTSYKYWATAKPVATEDKLFFPTSTWGIVAVNRVSGEYLWHQYEVFPNIFGSAAVVTYNKKHNAVFARVNYTLTQNEAIYRLSASSGSKAWHQYGLDSEPWQLNVDYLATGSDQVYTINGTRIMAYDITNGNMLWSTTTGGYGSVLYFNGTVYASGGVNVDHIDPSDGEVTSSSTCVGGVTGINIVGGVPICLGGTATVQSV